MRRITRALILLCASVPLWFHSPARADDPGLDIFRKQIKPLLTGKCLACHAGDKKKGGLDLSTRAAALKGGDSGPAFVAGSAKKSLLYDMVATKAMPPKNPLSAAQSAAFARWLDAGAPYEEEPLKPGIQRAGADWWSLQPVRRPELPPSKIQAQALTPVDRFIFAELEKHSLEPAPPAGRLALLRRVTVDLTGLPPTPEEIDAALADKSEQWYDAVVERLLSSPAYGERWGRHWLDVVRFGESHGYEQNHLRTNAWPYRDYVIVAFNDDKPYDRFIQEQLAGDVLGADAATGFLVAGVHDKVGNATEEGRRQQRSNDLDDIVTATGAAFLALTLNCAKCHDHKFDPIAQRDYYRLAAVFAGVRHGERPLHARPLPPRQGILFGRPPLAYLGQFTQPDASYILQRGDVMQRGAEVPPGALAQVPGMAADLEIDAHLGEAGRRLALARWIASPRNPLTARVLVNRVWQHHFGQGLVATPSDFGVNGARPSHPGLLDWLADYFMASGGRESPGEPPWSIKKLHRVIVRSATYRQSPVSANRQAAAVDAGNRLLWRVPLRRLEAEAVRDAVLQASGKLDRRRGGPGYRLFKYHVVNVGIYEPLEEQGPDTWRRGIYQHMVRAYRDELLASFDSPECAQLAPRRDVTTTPLQALALLNGLFIVQQAGFFAERVQKEAGQDVAAQVERAFVIAFGRKPDGGEARAAGEFVVKQGLSSLCRVLLNANEFLYY